MQTTINKSLGNYQVLKQIWETVRQATKMVMQVFWSFACCISWTHQNISNLSLFIGITWVDVHLDCLSLFQFLILKRGLSIGLQIALFFVNIPRCDNDIYVKNFFPQTARIWNSLSIECFPLTYDLNGFKSRINRYILTVGSF